MAHFAELESKTDPTGFTSDTHLIVKQVTVVANDVETAAGPLGENDLHVLQQHLDAFLVYLLQEMIL